MQMILHTPEEIKGTTWQKIQRQLRWLNDALTQAITADDPDWQKIQRQRYLNLLPAVHINGVSGSLLDAEPVDEAPEAPYMHGNPSNGYL